ncbi:MAG: hypothetical protein L3J45_04795 [Flavobacteriaceae bacterium]|nr:hypothetical protein [Flavobacteriaceae bacterium]
MPIYTYPLIYSISILIGLFNFHKFSFNKSLRFFLYFLIYTFISEIIGAYLGKVLFVENNIVYNTWGIVNFLFFSSFFLSRITHKAKRKIIYILIIIFIVATFINILFIGHYIDEYLINNAILSKILVVFTVIIYFTELLESDVVLNINKVLFYWIALGVLLYNLVFIPAFALFKYTSVYGVFQYITFGLNIIMHSCFIIGFIVCEKKYNY